MTNGQTNKVMPVQSGIEKKIPSLYKRTALTQLMFGFVMGARAALPTMTVKEAIYEFMKIFDLDDDDFNCDSAAVIFDRMQKDLITIKKT